MTADLHSLVAPYALNALDDDERTRFEAHLDQCADCRSELIGFQATAARLGDVTIQTPPAGLRERLLTEIASTPQERPVVTALTQRRGLRRALPGLVAAAAVVVAGLGVGGFLVERDNSAQEHDRNVAMTAVLSADDAEMTSKNFNTGGSVRLIASPSVDAAVILAKNLPNPGKGKVYQVWMVDKSGPSSQGTFVSDGEMIMEGVADANSIAVTVEPEGGSDLPTTAPVASIPV